MDEAAAGLVCAAAAYGLGSIPSGLLIARTRGIDIRAHGSGNIGATNVFRVLGKGPGTLTLLLDFLKGYIAAGLLPGWAGLAASPSRAAWAVLFGCAAVAGHAWPVFLRFRGGKGVATGAGAVLGFAPAAAGAGLLCWAAVALATRTVSVASMTTAVAVAAGSWWYYPSRAGLLPPLALTALAGLILWRHRSNLARLRNGTEYRIGRPAAGARPGEPKT